MVQNGSIETSFFLSSFLAALLSIHSFIRVCGFGIRLTIIIIPLLSCCFYLYLTFIKVHDDECYIYIDIFFFSFFFDLSK